METSLEDGTDILQPTKVLTQKQTNATESSRRLKDYFQNHQSLLWLFVFTLFRLALYGNLKIRYYFIINLNFLKTVSMI